MSKTPTVSLAYVTKWATTRGIVVVRDADLTERLAIWKGSIYVPSAHWTRDRDEAERRWRDAVKKAAILAQKKADRLSAMANGAPKYEERKP